MQFKGTVAFEHLIWDAIEAVLDIQYSGYYSGAKLNCRNDDCCEEECEIDFDIVGGVIKAGDDWVSISHVQAANIFLSKEEERLVQRKILKEEGIV